MTSKSFFLKPVVFPMDGYLKVNALFSDLRERLSNESFRQTVAYIKLNDALHMGDCPGPKLVENILSAFGDFDFEGKIFLDFKFGDTKGTNVNVLKHYQGLDIGIVTVRENIGIEALMKIREYLPDTKIAIVSALTDIPEDEIRRRWGAFPGFKIMNDITNILAEHFNRVDDEYEQDNLINMVVCSPLELPILTSNFRTQFLYTTPGIRDEWMTKGQQARITGIREALDAGANYVVAGAQMAKGNPDKGISAEESRQWTINEIGKDRYFTGDLLSTLIVCEGFYQAPMDHNGKIIGPLVGYAGKDSQGRNYVGTAYFNLASVEPYPHIRASFADLVARR